MELIKLYSDFQNSLITYSNTLGFSEVRPFGFYGVIINSNICRNQYDIMNLKYGRKK
jgi:hypothetical protein